MFIQHRKERRRLFASIFEWEKHHFCKQGYAHSAFYKANK
ncbi:hypothetical protein SPONN_1135 [uncultured Candidatus Thioglobus sp.]|nr:hypothetical protein SPONN_1135 [uncultured Candidatus Thioglobus sp.]